MRKIYFSVGVAAFLGVHGLMLAKIEPVYTFFFVFVWWSYIILVDSFIFWKRGFSLFSQLGTKILMLVFCSYIFWEFFELINSRLANWDYVSSPFGEVVFNNFAAKISFKILAFGSVLPVILETHNLLEFVGLGKRLKFLGWEKTDKFLKWEWWGRPSYLWIIVGIAMLAAALFWTTYLFWLVWIALILILDPVVERSGGRSIFSELREGNVRTFYRLLLTGLVCGVIWEGWNYWAGLKWVYEVPFVGGWKIFEMPVLGYPGFAVFAVECFLFYQWFECRWCRKNRRP